MADSLLINIEQIRELPHLHLFNYLKVDGASMYANFLQAVYEGLLYKETCLNVPQMVHLFSYNEYQFTFAKGSYLRLEEIGVENVPLNFEGFTGVVDWLMMKCATLSKDLPNPLLPFQAIGLVIYSTEFCVSDISTSKEHFRQAFYKGRAASKCERRNINELPAATPNISLQFTLSSIFRSRIVTKEQIEQVFVQLHLHRLIPDDIQVDWIASNQDYFELFIENKKNG